MHVSYSGCYSCVMCRLLLLNTCIKLHVIVHVLLISYYDITEICSTLNFVSVCDKYNAVFSGLGTVICGIPTLVSGLTGVICGLPEARLVSSRLRYLRKPVRLAKQLRVACLRLARRHCEPKNSRLRLASRSSSTCTVITGWLKLGDTR